MTMDVLNKYLHLITSLCVCDGHIKLFYRTTGACLEWIKLKQLYGLLEPRASSNFLFYFSSHIPFLTTMTLRDSSVTKFSLMKLFREMDNRNRHFFFGCNQKLFFVSFVKDIWFISRWQRDLLKMDYESIYSCLLS